MKNIKTFEQFSDNSTNEELNWKNLVAAGAIGAASVFGSPAQSQTVKSPKAQYTSTYDTKTVTTDTKSSSPTSVVEVSQLDAQSLKIKLQTNLNELRSDVNSKSLGPITQIKYFPSGPEKIKGELQFAISPKGENGVTNAQFEIQIKDGKYKVTVFNINFIHVGSQPVSAGQMIVKRAKPVIGTAAATATQRGISSALGGSQLGQTAGNVAAGVVQQAALLKSKPKSNFYLSDVDQNSDYSNQVKDACGKFFQSLENKFHAQSDF